MKKNFIFIMIGLALVFSAISFSFTKAPQVSASLPNGESYMSTTTSAASPSATVPFVVRKGTGVFGSLIIASSTSPVSVSTLPVRIYDSGAATTTSATSTLIASIRPGTGEQTLTFDVQVKYGLVVDIPAAFNGNYVFTYR